MTFSSTLRTLLLGLTLCSTVALVPGQSAAQDRRAALRQRAQGVNLRLANRVRTLRERISPVLRHGSMMALTTAVTAASAHSLAGQDLGSPVGLLSLAGVMVGTVTALHESKQTFKAAWPQRAQRIKQRLRRSKLLGPWFKDQRPLMQRLRRHLPRTPAPRLHRNKRR